MSSSSSPSRFLSGLSQAADPPESIPEDSDLVVILAALLCALICVFGLFAVVRCSCLRRAASTSRSMLHQIPADKGLKKKVLDSLPKSTFNVTSSVNNNNNNNGSKLSGCECAICLSEFVEGDEIRILPQCGHGFHLRCIDTWLASHSSCPSCRQILVVSDSRCQKCGEFPATSPREIDLEIGSRFKEAASSTTTTTQNDDYDNRFLP